MNKLALSCRFPFPAMPVANEHVVLLVNHLARFQVEFPVAPFSQPAFGEAR
jgi:hypothetical protein